ncbi:MAG TPA: hypothetical protein VKF40_29460 [Burkholderiales bacterium]|nr:hypothetical protein [Burkholderiales bacterium]
MNASVMARISRAMRTVGPYVAVALLPGGLFVAAFLWLFQNKHGRA